MVNAKEAMKLAWKLFRDNTMFMKFKTNAGRMRFFAQCLKAAWGAVKETARRAAMPVKELAREELAKLTAEIERLYYLPFGMRVEPRLQELKARRATYEGILAAV